VHREVLDTFQSPGRQIVDHCIPEPRTYRRDWPHPQRLIRAISKLADRPSDSGIVWTARHVLALDRGNLELREEVPAAQQLGLPYLYP
jgi:hypothetical protein